MYSTVPPTSPPPGNGGGLSPTARSPLNPAYRTPDVERSYSGGSTSSSRESGSSSSPINNNNTAYGVSTGAIGAGYGPFAYHANSAQGATAAGDFNAPPRPNYAESRYSVASQSDMSLADKYNVAPANANAQGLLWDAKDADGDDALHNPGPNGSNVDSRNCTVWTARGWLNMGALILLIAALIALFAGWPIAAHFMKDDIGRNGAFGRGGTNSTGQVPDLAGLPALIDDDTPDDALTRTGFDGESYNLVFSDEFNVDGRTFWEGDDPFWEAVDLHYWPTGDYEWYDPDGAITVDGALELTITEQPWRGLNYRSGMVTSWNKMCFTGGYFVAAVSLPGSDQVPGFWPGVWTMGNLGRAGYGATTEGTWPYTYDSCDVGTLPNQTNDGAPAEAEGLSYQPGQKLSACTCVGEEHPGPTNRKGRAAPEIDALEAQVAEVGGQMRGEASQSVQMAPYNAEYEWDNTSATIYDAENTFFNPYTGGIYQQAASALTYIPSDTYSGDTFTTFGFEYTPRDHITWELDGQTTWTATQETLGADTAVEISERLISEEPMYVILNLGLSSGFQRVDFENLVFPDRMRIDYVRVYQRAGHESITCDPEDFPTAQYIEDHIEAYTNANLTTWTGAGYHFPYNSLIDGCER